MADLHVSWEEYRSKTENLAKQIHKDGWGFNQVVCIAKGGMTLVGENGPELVNMPGGARVTQAGPTQGFLSNLGNMASSVMDASPFGAAANAVGNIFGGGSKDEQVELLKQILAAVQQPPPVVIGDGQVAQISTKISAQKSFKK